MIRKLTEQLKGEFKTVDAYTADISPCIDCRKCRESLDSACVINDQMQEVYEYLESCDNVVIASPIYFSELTGKLLDIVSRFQSYFSARYFRRETPKLKPKKGVVLLTGGGSGNPQKPYETAILILKCINTQQIHPLVCSHNTDNIPADQDESILVELEKAAVFLNSPTK